MRFCSYSSKHSPMSARTASGSSRGSRLRRRMALRMFSSSRSRCSILVFGTVFSIEIIRCCGVWWRYMQLCDCNLLLPSSLATGHQIYQNYIFRYLIFTGVVFDIFYRDMYHFYAGNTRISTNALVNRHKYSSPPLGGSLQHLAPSPSSYHEYVRNIWCFIHIADLVRTIRAVPHEPITPQRKSAVTGHGKGRALPSREYTPFTMTLSV